MSLSFTVPPRSKTLFIFAFATSILISAWIGWRETVVNPDAICYLLSANMVGAEGVRHAMQLCGQAQWPFYSLLIHYFSQLTHMGVTLAAYTLNGFFSLVSVTAFILIVKELGGSQRVLWLAAITILLSHQFNSVREYIIRDHGFWAFYLASMYFLLKFARRPRFKFSLAFNFSLLLATLFRIEGLIFWILLPFVSWFQRRYSIKQRARNFLILYFPLMLGGAAMLGWLMIHPSQSIHRFGRVAEVVTQFQHGFSLILERYHAAKSELGHSFLGAEAADEAGMVIFSSWLTWYVLSVVNNLSWIYALLVVYAWRTRTIILRSTAPIIMSWYIVVNVVVTGGFLAEHLFLSKRYLIALSLVFMLWVPFALDDIIRKWPSVRHRIALFIVVLLIMVSAVGGIFDFGYSKAYIRDAGNWLSRHAPDKAVIFTNDIQVMYYSNHFGNSIFDKQRAYNNIAMLRHGKWKKYDFVALRLDKKELKQAMPLLHEINAGPVKTYKNHRGDRVIIFKIPHRGVAS